MITKQYIWEKVIKNIIKYDELSNKPNDVIKGVTDDYLKQAKTLEDWRDVAIKLIEFHGKKTTIKQVEKWVDDWYDEIQRGVKTKKDLDNYGKTKGKKINPINILLDNYISNVEHFYSLQPFFYDKNGLFWFWKPEEYKYEQVDEVDLMNSLDDVLGFMGQTVSSRVKSCYIEAFKRVGRKKIPKTPPKEWVQFRDKVININNKEIFEVDKKYFFTNPIPWDFGKSEKTPIINKLFKDWVGKDDVDKLYEILAYCCYTDYPIHLIFCFVGSGRNGKTQFQKLLTNFVGVENMCSTELDLLISNRFESFKLYKKLVCTMGETNFGILKNTSLLKKLSGQDLIGFEKKNVNGFDDYNYAKIIISSNSLPTSQDTSEGFYRRWMIIDFMNEFEEGKDIIKTIPNEEYNNLALKVSKILPELLEQGKFTKQGSIKERMDKYILSSNPFPAFIEEYCEKDTDEFMLYGELYTEFVKFLRLNKKRKVLVKEFRSALEDEGFIIERTSKKIGDEWKSGYWVVGVKLIKKVDKKVRDIRDIRDYVSTQSLYIGKLNEKSCMDVTKITKKSDIILNLLEKNGPTKYETLQEIMVGVPETIILDTITVLKERGDIFENPNGVYHILK